MSNETISSKLQELFDLYNSGAISQEEYNLLKSEILNVGSNSDSKPKESKSQAIHQNEVNKNLIDGNHFEAAPIQEKIQEPPITIIPNKPVQEKKGRKIWLYSLIGVVCIIIMIVIMKLSSADSDVVELQEQTVKDIDGNIYHTIKLGTQVWMVENLRTTKYNDGTAIPLVTENTSWKALITPAYCWYDNDEATNKKTYGALYNWYTINTNNLCPIGWHVPSDSEWTILTDYLTNNGYGYQGNETDISKSLASKSGWTAFSEIGSIGNEQSNNNKSGFTAFASGIRFNDGAFLHRGNFAKWWSSTETSDESAQIRLISWNNGFVTTYSNDKQNGFSVRCVKDLSESEKSVGVINNPIVEGKIAVWDEASATKIIMDEISKHPSEWNNDLGIHVKEMSHKVYPFKKLDIGNKDLMAAFVISTFDGGCPPYCGGILSLFEFEENQGSWSINRNAKGFTYFMDDGNWLVYNISPNDYGLMVTNNINDAKWGIATRKELFAFVNDSLIKTLSLYNEGAKSIEIKTKLNSENSYLQVEMTENDNKTLTYYKFNGSIYEEFVGTITDPSLTSMNRFIDINSLTQQKNGICSLCNGTGIQVCPLCGGTGVANNGMECNCVRTYNMEKLAGHTPSNPPLRWSCPRCSGTGVSKN